MQQQRQQLIQQQKQKLPKPSEILANTDCKWIANNLDDGHGNFCALGALRYEIRKLGLGTEILAKIFGGASMWLEIVHLNNTSPTHSYKECIEYLQFIGF